VRIVKVYIIICVCVWCVMDLMMNVYRVMMMRKDFKRKGCCGILFHVCVVVVWLDCMYTICGGLYTVCGVSESV